MNYMNNRSSLAKGFSIFISLLGLILSNNSFGQGKIEEIVVTAERRTTNLQDVPMSINAFTSDMVEKQRIDSFEDLALKIPGFSLLTFSKSRVNPALRGGSSSLNSAGAENGVGLFIDDIYFGGSGDFSVDLFDVERIEVLRGPQGTLFGRNTTGGSINVVTRNPTEETEGKLGVSYGNYDYLQFRGFLSGQVADDLYGLIAFSSTDRDGTSFNRTTGNNIDNVNRTSARGKLRWELDNDLQITATLGVSVRDETSVARDAIFLPNIPITHSLLQGYVPDNDTRVTSQFTDGRYESEQYTAGLRIEKGFNIGQLLSITSFRYFDTDDAQTSLAGAPVPLFALAEPRRTKAISQEFRFISGLDSSLNFVSGLYFYHADEDRKAHTTSHWDLNAAGAGFQSLTFCPTENFATAVFGIVDPSCTGPGLITTGNRTVTLDSLFTPNDFSLSENVKTTSYAIFTELKYDITDAITATAGGRWTLDVKELDGGSQGAADFFWNPQPGLVVANDEQWDEFTYRFGLDWHATDDIMLYGTTSKGFRSGAYDIAQSDVSLAGLPVAPEIVFSHELGLRSQLFGNRVQLNVTGFHTTYEDLQFFIGLVGPEGGSATTTNAGEAEVVGVEVDFIATLTDELTLTFQYSHQDGDSKRIPAEADIPEGTPPAGTVPNTYIVALNYDTTLANGGELYASFDYTHKDRYSLEFNDTPQFQSEVDALVNARLAYTFPNGKWEVAAWGKNLTDEDIIVFGQDFWFSFYDGFTGGVTNPEVMTETSQPRYAEPRTYGVSLSYSF